mgnify:CR=1 FL=1|tara:strand:- start:179 stop:343 length:165 start_codon:yes stop_codon:yes gene_type:complete
MFGGMNCIFFLMDIKVDIKKKKKNLVRIKKLIIILKIYKELGVTPDLHGQEEPY